jgi:pilus assembly protein CpaB
MLLAMANRPIDTNTTFTTGGDVSRFQRRTVPAKPQVAEAMAGMGKALGQAIAGAAGAAGAGSSHASFGGVRVVRGNDDSGAR